MERSCLRRAPGGDWLLYMSWEDPPASGRWRIDVLSGREPGQFDIAAAQPVLSPVSLGVDAVKDPYVIGHGGQQVMFVSTFLTPRGPAPTSLATGNDGRRFEWQGEALAVGPGWDGYQARLSCVAAVDGGFVGYHDGAASVAQDTEERCGIACSVDLRTWRRVSDAAPALVSPHASGSLRYVDVVAIAGEWWAYYEHARADGSHELRRNRLSR